MVSYKEWGYQLYPSLAFEDLASRTEKLGGKERVRDLMRELRDKERDRVVEAKFGKSAMDDARAQEAADMAEKADGADGDGAQKQKDSEKVEKQLANSRYTDIDGKGGLSSNQGSGQWNGAASKAAAAPPAVGALSAEVRARMEANRRLALERLRRKKEEAVASTAGTVVGKSTSATLLPADTIDKGVNDHDLMDVDAGVLNGDAGDNFEDDEAALAEMEAEEPATKKSKLSVDTATPTTTLVESNNYLSVDKTVAPELPEAPSFTVDTLANSTEKSPVDGGHDANHDLPTARTDKTTVSDSTDNELVGKAIAPTPGSTDEGSTAMAHPPASESAVGGTTTSTMDIPTANGEQGTHADDAKSGGAVEEKAADDSNGCEDKAISNTAESSVSGSVSAAVFGAVKGSVKVVDENLPVGSPQKFKAAVGEVPMSPLGRMLADTDTPAEGGSLAVRAPIAGLFADKP